MRGNPYRGEHRDQEQSPRQIGIVDDMVRQFADPYAFVRELVQNSIDAGCTSVRTHVSFDESGRAWTTVSDDGSGMSRDDIESCLLTLFASSKENAQGKIGKYGIGFMSVLGIDPEEVVVETWRADASYVVRLYANQRYVLESGLPREGTGTRVTLLSSMDSAAFERHGTSVRGALRKWCRHASVPVLLTVQLGKRAPQEERIDVPFDIIAPVKVSEVEGEEAIVVGCEAGCGYLREAVSSPEGPARFIGFYNRGLTLLETSNVTFPGLGGLRCKIMSPSLRHTLSRDNVRRDDAFERMLDRARALARKLSDAVRARMHEVAERISHEGWTPQYEAVLAAAATHVPTGQVSLPLVEPVGGRRTISVADAKSATDADEPCLVASEANELTAALAARGAVIIRCAPETGAAPSGTNILIASLLRPRGMTPVDRRYCLTEASASVDATEAALCEALKTALATAGTQVAAIGWVASSPAINTTVVVDDVRQRPLVVRRTSLVALKSESELRRGTVLLRRDDPIVRSGLAHARRGQVELAALLLARIVLLENRGSISAAANQALLEASLQAAARVEGERA